MRAHPCECPRLLPLLATLGLWGGCGPAGPAPRYPMVDVAAQAGLDLCITSGGEPTSQLTEVKGGGVALLDADGDGDLDLFVPNGATPDSPDRGPGARLFRNLGGLRFEDMTEAAGIEHARWSFGCAVGDVDADGQDDLFIACLGPDVLLRGRGDGTFEDRSAAAGIEGDGRWSSAASFGDLDGDGDLDLYVVGYVELDPRRPPPPMEFRGARVFGGPMGLPAVPDRVHENLGDGTFRDATADWGFDAVPASYGLGAVIVDLDGDGRAEVLVGNDSQANFLFRRGDDGRFVDVGAGSGLALDASGFGQATMGIALGDVNGDGLADVFTSNFMAAHDTLHVSQGDLRYEELSRLLGLALVTTPYLGWAAEFVDLDLDGREELLVFHGHVYPEETTAPMGWRTDQEPQLFERVGERFELVPPAEGGPWLAEPHRDRGAAFGDLDDDGDVDVVVTELNGPLRLLRNDAAAGHWLRVRLADRREGAGNPRGLGARVEVLRGGARLGVRWIVSGTSYQSASAQEAHFGLGGLDAPVQVRVHWPDGHVQEVAAVAADQVLEVGRP